VPTFLAIATKTSSQGEISFRPWLTLFRLRAFVLVAWLQPSSSAVMPCTIPLP
jgi:hypothetical protein